jgi:hypothetical protein
VAPSGYELWQEWQVQSHGSGESGVGMEFEVGGGEETGAGAWGWLKRLRRVGRSGLSGEKGETGWERGEGMGGLCDVVWSWGGMFACNGNFSHSQNHTESRAACVLGWRRRVVADVVVCWI